jgi:hypothetical protein
MRLQASLLLKRIRKSVALCRSKRGNYISAWVLSAGPERFSIHVSAVASVQPCVLSFANVGLRVLTSFAFMIALYENGCFFHPLHQLTGFDSISRCGNVSH